MEDKRRGSSKVGAIPKEKDFDEEQTYPTIEENVDRKLVRFFDYGRRLKGQIKAMQQRELNALKELHSDGNDVVAGNQEPVVIYAINFKAVNEIYDT